MAPPLTLLVHEIAPQRARSGDSRHLSNEAVEQLLVSGDKPARQQRGVCVESLPRRRRRLFERSDGVTEPQTGVPHRPKDGRSRL